MKFRMVDRVFSFVPREFIRASKTVSFEEYTSKDAFGLPPQLPPTLTLESLIQSASWLIVLSSDFAEVGVLESMEMARFGRPLGPGERMLVDVQVESWGDVLEFTGVGRSGSGEIIRCQSWRMARRPLEQHHNADDVRVLFSEIYRSEEVALP